MRINDSNVINKLNKNVKSTLTLHLFDSLKSLTL